MKPLVTAIALTFLTGLFSGADAREKGEEPACSVVDRPAGP